MEKRTYTQIKTAIQAVFRFRLFRRWRCAGFLGVLLFFLSKKS
jgi:hypothetical protein